ncbi:MAG: flagellar FliJ family protein, partial [Spirochaetales bacterium]|nr:flagellar FliJ family protein [Spirochaetales bacterium]
RLADEAGRLRRDLATAEEHRAVAAVAFREAKRNADVLQKLKERREADYMRAQKRDEQHRLDEISQRIHLRSEE